MPQSRITSLRKCGRQATRYHIYILRRILPKVEDLPKGKLIEKGIMTEPSIRQARQEDHFGYIFEGVIKIPEDGVYTFGTKSDDGSVLYIDGQKVVDNDGSHAAITATGRIALKKDFTLIDCFILKITKENI